jgi:hypothetical protein
VLEEARDATDMIWQEAERERIGVEAETIRLETLRHRSLEQLGRVYGHLESVLDEVRAGIGRVEEEQEDLDEAIAAAAARLGVEPPASSPEESPRFPSARDIEHRDQGGGGAVLSATRPDSPAPDTAAATPAVGSLPAVADGGPEQPALSDADESPSGHVEATQPVLGDATTETTPPGDKTEAIQPLAEDGAAGTANGEGQPGDQDATQRLDAVGTTDNSGNRPHSPKPTAKEGKGRP